MCTGKSGRASDAGYLGGRKGASPQHRNLTCNNDYHRVSLFGTGTWIAAGQRIGVTHRHTPKQQRECVCEREIEIRPSFFFPISSRCPARFDVKGLLHDGLRRGDLTAGKRKEKETRKASESPDEVFLSFSFLLADWLCWPEPVDTTPSTIAQHGTGILIYRSGICLCWVGRIPIEDLVALRLPQEA